MEFDFGYRRHTDEFVLLRNDPAYYANNHADDSWQAALRRKQALGRIRLLLWRGRSSTTRSSATTWGNITARVPRFIWTTTCECWAASRFRSERARRFSVPRAANFSPSVAAGYWLRAGFKLKGSASHAFRLPTYTDLYYSDPATVGNPNLQPETASDYEGGLVWDRGGHYEAEVTVFERRERNGIDYVRASPADMWHAENIDVLNFTGVETSLTVRLPRRQRLQFAYTGLYGNLQSLNGLQSEYTSNYPVDDGSVTWQGMLPGSVVARTRIGVIDRYNGYRYALWDLSVAREFHYVAAHLGLSNLTNTQYQEIQGVAMPGRSVVFGLEFILSKKSR